MGYCFKRCDELRRFYTGSMLVLVVKGVAFRSTELGYLETNAEIPDLTGLYFLVYHHLSGIWQVFPKC